ncbi:MAG: ATP-binding protein, partial [Saccharothrix sp.]|nr:ATP-binding protein [Saccharothrix sp.]
MLEVLIGLARASKPEPIVPGLYDLDRWQQWWKDALDSPIRPVAASGSDADAVTLCPYPGLTAFTAENAPWFFGRERSTAELVRRLADAAESGGMVVLTGASGVGKSSLIRAGLLPAIATGGPSVARTLLMTPGADPLDQLRRTLRDGGDAGGRLLLVVDQFEEVFTLCADDGDRQGFVEALASMARRPTRGDGEPALVLVGVRADFYARCLEYPELTEALQNRQMALGPMTAPELHAAITSPAKAVGLEVE